MTILNYIAQRYCLSWRTYLTKTYLKKWRESSNKNSVDNPDQRLQEDLRLFTILIESLYAGVITSFATLIIFIPILWNLSHLSGTGVPGWFLWIGIGWVIIGTAVSFLVGKKIPFLEYHNQRTEADFRYSLVHIRDGADIKEGETDKKYSALFKNHVKLYDWIKYFTFWQTSYMQVCIILPVVCSYWGLFGGLMTLGSLMMVMHAFDEVSKSLSYIIENYRDIAELVSVNKRLGEFVKGL